MVYTNTNAIQQKLPQIQKTLDWVGLSAPVRYGVMKERSQLKNQLAAVVMDRPFARVWSENISPVTTQAHGPNVEAFFGIRKLDLYDGNVYLTKKRHVYAYEGELNALRSEIWDWSRRATGRDNILRNAHANCSNQKHWATSKIVDCPETWERHDNIDTIHDDLQDKRVG